MLGVGESDECRPAEESVAGLGLELDAIRDDVNGALGSLVVCVACIAGHSSPAEVDAVEGARLAVRQIANAMAMLRTIAASTRLVEQKSGVFRRAGSGAPDP